MPKDTHRTGRTGRTGSGVKKSGSATVGAEKARSTKRDRIAALAVLREEVVGCRRCPRLVDWREEVAATKRAAYRHDDYWGKPLPGFGDPAASLVVIGLAPAAHGANRTGRVFTGDRSGDWLYGGLYRAGYANQPESTSADDGMELTGAYITAPVRCAPPANKPTPTERDNCAPFLVRELHELTNMRVVLVLGSFAYQAMTTFFGVKPRPKFGHGVEVPLDNGATLICSYHVSQQNTFTGKLTEEMLDRVFQRSRELGRAG